MNQWTDEQENTFAQIMRMGRLERIRAIQLYRRCGSNPEKALKYARENVPTHAQEAAYAATRTKRVAALVKARTARRKEYPVSSAEFPVGLVNEAGQGNTLAL